MTKLETYIQLFKKHHILHFNKKLVVTNKFHRDFSLEEMQNEINEQAKGASSVPNLSPEPVKPVLPVPVKPVSPPPSFKQFIIDAEVPEKLYLSNGSHYWANRYSVPADKAFQKAMSKGVQYDVLVIATKLYYKAGGARVTIANFIQDGIWESFYDSMLDSMQKGTTDKLIKKNLSEGDEGYSRYN